MATSTIKKKGQGFLPTPNSLNLYDKANIQAMFSIAWLYVYPNIQAILTNHSSAWVYDNITSRSHDEC
jgi:hypothetical protein